MEVAVSAPVRAGAGEKAAPKVQGASLERSGVSGRVAKMEAASVAKQLAASTTGTGNTPLASKCNNDTSSKTSTSTTNGSNNVAVNPFAFTGVACEVVVPPRQAVQVNAFSLRAKPAAPSVPTPAQATPRDEQAIPKVAKEALIRAPSHLKKESTVIMPPQTAKSGIVKASASQSSCRGALAARNTLSKSVSQPNSKAKAPQLLLKKGSPPSKKASPSYKATSKPKKVSPPRKAVNPFAAMI